MELSAAQDKLSISMRKNECLRQKAHRCTEKLHIVEKTRKLLVSDMTALRNFTENSTGDMRYISFHRIYFIKCICRSTISEVVKTVVHLQTTLKDQAVQDSIISLEQEKCSSALARIKVLDATVSDFRSRVVALNDTVSSTSHELATERERVTELQQQLQRREDYWKRELESTEQVHMEHLENLRSDHREALDALRYKDLLIYIISVDFPLKKKFARKRLPKANYLRN